MTSRVAVDRVAVPPKRDNRALASNCRGGMLGDLLRKFPGRRSGEGQKAHAGRGCSLHKPLDESDKGGALPGSWTREHTRMVAGLIGKDFLLFRGWVESVHNCRVSVDHGITSRRAPWRLPTAKAARS
jgi:hypothetical protein